jgi:hypothetical protein
VLWTARILPQIEQGALYNQIDFNYGEGSAATDGDRGPNATIRANIIPAYLCPSDPARGGVPWKAPNGTMVTGPNLTDAYGRLSYVANAGSGASESVNGNGLFGTNSKFGLRDCTDGTSNTLAVAEGIIGFPHDQATDPTGTPPACPTTGTVGSANMSRGHSWFWAYRAGAAAFSTGVVPNNQRTWDCNLASAGVFRAARSYHTGTVHGLLADGSVRSITDNIDATTWLRLGSRNDGQPLGEF